MSAQCRDTDAGAAEHQIGDMEHLTGFIDHLQLFFGVAVGAEGVDVRDQVERDAVGKRFGVDRFAVEDLAGLVDQFLHTFGTRAGSCLIGGGDHALDGGELLGDKFTELKEDILVGQIPDHSVVVLSVDISNGTVTVYDPNSLNQEDTYPVRAFENAWNDSKNYMVAVSGDCMKPYDPKPIDVSDVVLPEDLNELREAIAENAHDVWAAERKAQGWTYGQQRDDAKKETPCMVPYSKLPDSEKTFDRNMAMNTLKLLMKLGYDIVKR